MLNEPYLQDIPDELPPSANPELEPGEVAEIEGLHAHVRTLLQKVQRRRQELFEKHQSAIDMSQAPRIRLNLLIQHGLGVLSKARLEYEAHYLKLLDEALDESFDLVTKPKAKQIHLANGGVVNVDMDEVDKTVAGLMEVANDSERTTPEETNE